MHRRTRHTRSPTVGWLTVWLVVLLILAIRTKRRYRHMHGGRNDKTNDVWRAYAAELSAVRNRHAYLADARRNGSYPYTTQDNQSQDG